MNKCLHLARKIFGNKDIIYIVKILKRITAMKTTQKKDKSKVKI